MKTYLISFDFEEPRRNFHRLYEAIKTYGIWCKINESVWIIKTDNSTIEIRDFLKQYIYSNDGIFVVKTSREAAWNNIKVKTEWLKNNL